VHRRPTLDYAIGPDIVPQDRPGHCHSSPNAVTNSNNLPQRSSLSNKSGDSYIAKLAASHDNNLHRNLRMKYA